MIECSNSKTLTIRLIHIFGTLCGYSLQWSKSGSKNPFYVKIGFAPQLLCII